MQTVHVAAAVVMRDEKVLAAKRADAEGPLCWEFPGGKIEPGEAPADALRREAQEELGCRLGASWFYDTIEHDYADFHLTMECFVCTLAPGEEPRASAGVHDELRWLSQDQMLSVGWLDADKKLATSVGVFWDQIFEPEHF